MDIWRICALFCILGCVSGTINQYFDVFNGLAGIGCLEIDDTIPDNVVVSKDVENARGTHDAESCDTLFSAYVKDIPVLIGGRVYNTAVRWDPSKGVFNVKTLLYEIPEAQTNNTVVLILQQVNSFALEFKSCQVGEKREFRIHLQVEITSGTTIQIDAGLSENYAFVDAGITLFGIYTASAGVQMTWNEWSSMALVGNVQLVALGKDRGYISSLGSVAKLIGNGPKEIVIDLQNT
ncbi:uncharacterized protein LOC127856428 [Dreissena polymorpha]|uniref:Uncharacterized protein n=1 Tax=Dreissena polymorpha TaxID=45954 RepID=A0A9D4HFK3_DREPO|nr:uncharacterized protein LOC127856428 [Dreissena polymorpha]KAH3717335.1 hypothetical protein DPMN_060118 [Dreissena polymorpha]